MLKPRASKGPNKGPWSRPLADLIGPVINPVLARQGFSQSDLILFWDDIVGDRLAAMSQPIKLQWPARHRAEALAGGQASATLIVRVETGFALELQHLSGAIIERVNAHLGWRCVTKLSLKQGPVERRPNAKPERPPVDPGAAQAAEKLVRDVADEALRLALARLGARVLTDASRRAQAQKNGRTP